MTRVCLDSVNNFIEKYVKLHKEGLLVQLLPHSAVEDPPIVFSLYLQDISLV